MELIIFFEYAFDTVQKLNGFQPRRYAHNREASGRGKVHTYVRGLCTRSYANASEFRTVICLLENVVASTQTRAYTQVAFQRNAKNIKEEE